MAVVAVADIGGTNCRIALFSTTPRLNLLDCRIVPTRQIPDAHSLWLNIQALRGQRHLASVAIALAAPVANGRGELTNGTLCLDERGLQSLSKGVPCVLCNDFTAQAYACLTGIGLSAQLVAGKGVTNTNPEGNRGVLGAGTGLGMAMLVDIKDNTSQERWLAVPSEGGHASFPFVGEAEFAFAHFARKALGVEDIAAEQVLSGPGLALLHCYLTGENLSPPDVGDKALHSETETLTWFARFYGRACRNWVLSSLCTGGLWIAGGIAAANPLCVQHPVFASAYLQAGKQQKLVAQTPVYLMTDSTSGLWGAAYLASSCCS